MPAFTSKAQYRMMMAIKNGKERSTRRGDKGPPKDIANGYYLDGSYEDLPETQGKELKGGRWDGQNMKSHHERHKTKNKGKASPNEEYDIGRSKSVEPHERKKSKNKKSTPLKKTKENGVGIVVVNDRGEILFGRHGVLDKEIGQWAIPGGGIEPNESARDAAIRELKEETGVSLSSTDHIEELKTVGNDKTFLVRLKETPNHHSTEELKDVGFYPIDNIDINDMRACCYPSLKAYLDTALIKYKNKPLKLLIAQESLNKNIIRTGQRDSAVHEFTHGDALKLVGNGAYRMLRDAVKDMKDDESKIVNFGDYRIHVRKHANDIYSGNIDDGLKTIHQFSNRSLPSLTGEVMSVFEWYLPEDNPELTIHSDEELTDDTISDAIDKLTGNYKSYNLTDIHDEMHNIREEIRHGNAVDLQQVEQKILKLFDKLEERLTETQNKHNSLARKAGKEIDELYSKLARLQDIIEKKTKTPSKIEAYSSKPENPIAVHAQHYMYLSKPRVVVHPTGHIAIDFATDWTSMEKENFVKDMRAVVVKKIAKQL